MKATLYVHSKILPLRWKPSFTTIQNTQHYQSTKLPTNIASHRRILSSATSPHHNHTSTSSTTHFNIILSLVNCLHTRSYHKNYEKISSCSVKTNKRPAHYDRPFATLIPISKFNPAAHPRSVVTTVLKYDHQGQCLLSSTYQHITTLSPRYREKVQLLSILTSCPSCHNWHRVLEGLLCQMSQVQDQINPVQTFPFSNSDKDKTLSMCLGAHAG